MAYPDHTPEDPDLEFGSQGLILHVMNSLEFGVNRRIKPIGVKKSGTWDLMPGVRCGINQVNGRIVVVNVVATA
jgi:hypothetical protein